MSIQFPSLPTDNLYKFLTIGGLFIIFASLYAVFYLGLKIEMLEAELSVETDVLKHESEILKADRLLLKKYSTAQASHKKQIRKISEKTEISLKEMEISLAKTAIKLKQTQIYIEYYNKLIRLTYVSTFIGGMMLVNGFRSWYRWQKLQDKILYTQIKKED